MRKLHVRYRLLPVIYLCFASIGIADKLVLVIWIIQKLNVTIEQSIFWSLQSQGSYRSVVGDLLQVKLSYDQVIRPLE